jgi:hypothetical protein
MSNRPVGGRSSETQSHTINVNNNSYIRFYSFNITRYIKEMSEKGNSVNPNDNIDFYTTIVVLFLDYTEGLYM